MNNEMLLIMDFQIFSLFMYMSLNYSNPDLLKGILTPFFGTEAIHDHLVSEVWFLVSSESSLVS